MTKVDVDRTLREKTDFVDKIIQFKGINPEKDNYLANIHHQNTSSLTDFGHPVPSAGGFGNPQSPRDPTANPAAYTTRFAGVSGLNLNRNSNGTRNVNSNSQPKSSTRSTSVPVMTPNSPGHISDDGASINSSISTGSEGIEVQEQSPRASNEMPHPSSRPGGHPGHARQPNQTNDRQSQSEASGSGSSSTRRQQQHQQQQAQDTSAHQKSSSNSSSTTAQSSSNKRLKMEHRGSTISNSSHISRSSTNHSDATILGENDVSQSNISTVSSAPRVFERERMQHNNAHDTEGTPKHQTYKVEDLHDNELLRLQRYTVKELKNFLNAESVNYSGLIEKHELYEKAKNLVLDRRNNEKILKEQTDDGNQANDGKPEADVEKDVCKVCWDATINCVLLECGHMCACISCSKKLMECPICRQHVVRCVHVFRV